jgi:hypothetical protein
MKAGFETAIALLAVLYVADIVAMWGVASGQAGASVGSIAMVLVSAHSGYDRLVGGVSPVDFWFAEGGPARAERRPSLHDSRIT